jgi:hypothetical protein
MKTTKDWIIAVLLTIIFSLIGWSVHREISRLDRSIEVLHVRITKIDDAMRNLK